MTICLRKFAQKNHKIFVYDSVTFLKTLSQVKEHVCMDYFIIIIISFTNQSSPCIQLIRVVTKNNIIIVIAKLVYNKYYVIVVHT